MEVLAAFLLVVALIVFVILGVGFYMLVMWLRRRQLNPQEDKVEGHDESERQTRPQHVTHEHPQRARFIGTR